MKRLLSVLLTLIFIFSYLPVSAAKDYDEEGAYNECCTLYPDFINKIKDLGIKDEQLTYFVKSVEDKILEQGIELTEENFDDLMFKAFKAAFELRRNLPVRNALLNAYPASVEKAMKGIITEEFMPIYITVKRFLFGIQTPVITLSGDKSDLLVHHVYMPEDVKIVVGFYTEDGTLLQAYINPKGGTSCEAAAFAVAFAFKGNTLSPLCESYILNF